MIGENQIAKNILLDYFENYKTVSFLLPELIELVIENLIEEKMEYDDDGNLKSQGILVDGKKHGAWLEWNKGWKTSTTFLHGIEHGEWVKFDTDGQIYNQLNFANGKKHGECKMWWRVDQLYRCGTFANDKRHGEWKEWHENGQLHTSSMWVGGKKHGMNTEWHRNGQIYFQGCYVDGEKHGVCNWWHGQIHTQKTYVNGMPNIE